MTTSAYPAPHTTRRSTQAGSWLALVAATSLGWDDASTVTATVRADEGLSDACEYRLVVQSYDAPAGELPGVDARPVGSLQRSVTAAELREGVRVKLVERRRSDVGDIENPVIVAWVEVGRPDLEYDARRARPPEGSFYGVVPRPANEACVDISLRSSLAS